MTNGEDDQNCRGYRGQNRQTTQEGKIRKKHAEWNVCGAVGKETWLKPKQSDGGTRAKSG